MNSKYTLKGIEKYLYDKYDVEFEEGKGYRHHSIDEEDPISSGLTEFTIKKEDKYFLIITKSETGIFSWNMTTKINSLKDVDILMDLLNTKHAELKKQYTKLLRGY